MRRLTVPLADRSYEVVVGRGVATELATLLPSTAQRAAVVTQDGILADIELPGVEITTFTIGQGESAKTLDTIATLMLVRSASAASQAAHSVSLRSGGLQFSSRAGGAAIARTADEPAEAAAAHHPVPWCQP